MAENRFRLLVKAIPASIGGGYMALVADSDVVGQIQEDAGRGLAIRVPRELERGSLVGEKDVLKVLEDPQVVSILLYGSRAVSVAVGAGYVHRESVLNINGLEHAIVYKFSLG